MLSNEQILHKWMLAVEQLFAFAIKLQIDICSVTNCACVLVRVLMVSYKNGGYIFLVHQSNLQGGAEELLICTLRI